MPERKDVHMKTVHISGIEKRYKPTKHYVYVLDVKWSDGSHYPIYRKFSDFFQFHEMLVDIFPAESGKTDTNRRLIQPLPGKKVSRSEARTVVNKRKDSLAVYCSALIKLDGRISQHNHVIRFFKPCAADLAPPRDSRVKPEKSGLLKALTLTLPRSKKKDKSLDSIGSFDSLESEISISGPITLETYRAIGTYKAVEKGEVSFLEDDYVEIVEKNDNGWWFVQVEDQQGWAPASYLQPDGEPEMEEPAPLFNYEQYLVLVDYTAELDDEVNIKAGAVVNVMHKLLDGWWIVHHNGKVGYAPATYLTPYNPKQSDGQSQTVPRMPTETLTSDPPDLPNGRPDQLGLPNQPPKQDETNPTTSRLGQAILTTLTGLPGALNNPKSDNSATTSDMPMYGTQVPFIAGGSIKKPAQRRCTIKSRKLSDKERQNSRRDLGMYRKMSVKMQQRSQKRQQWRGRLAPPEEATEDYVSPDEIDQLCDQQQSEETQNDNSHTSNMAMHVRDGKGGQQAVGRYVDELNNKLGSEGGRRVAHPSRGKFRQAVPVPVTTGGDDTLEYEIMDPNGEPHEYTNLSDGDERGSHHGNQLSDDEEGTEYVNVPAPRDRITRKLSLFPPDEETPPSAAPRNGAHIREKVPTREEAPTRDERRSARMWEAETLPDLSHKENPPLPPKGFASRIAQFEQ